MIFIRVNFGTGCNCFYLDTEKYRQPSHIDPAPYHLEERRERDLKLREL